MEECYCIHVDARLLGDSVPVIQPKITHPVAYFGCVHVHHYATVYHMCVYTLLIVMIHLVPGFPDHGSISIQMYI